MTSQPSAPEVCPVCGEDVPRGALACPECGADHRSGWREDAEHEGVDLGDDDFDYEEFASREFSSSPKPAGIAPVWWIAGLILLAALLAMFLR